LPHHGTPWHQPRRLEKRYRDEGSWYYEIVARGYKYNLTDIAAAVGLVQLRKAESMWRRRKLIAEMYDAAFGPLDALEVPYRNEHSAHSWHLYPLRLQLDRLRVTRTEFIEELKRRRIGSSVHFIPLHLHGG